MYSTRDILPFCARTKHHRCPAPQYSLILPKCSCPLPQESHGQYTFARFPGVAEKLAGSPCRLYVQAFWEASNCRAGNIMQNYDGIVNAIGNTPLITLKRASAETGCTIL